MTSDSGIAVDTSRASCAGHQLSGRRSFRKQRTVNPLMVPARYNFLYSSFKAGPAGGLRPPAAGRRLGRQSRTEPVSGCTHRSTESYSQSLEFKGYLWCN